MGVKPYTEDQPERGRARAGNIPLPLGAVSIGAGLLALALLIALVVVASVEDADILATVALILAVLAFAVQIVVYIAQAWQSSQQAVRAEQLNTQTRELVGRIEATAQGTQQVLADQHNQIVTALISAASKTASEDEAGGFDPDAFEERLMENVRRELDAQAPSPAPGPPAYWNLDPAALKALANRNVEAGRFVTNSDARKLMEGQIEALRARRAERSESPDETPEGAPEDDQSKEGG